MTVLFSSEIYCTDCWSWVLHGIRAKVEGTFIRRYVTAGGQWYCTLNRVCYSEHYMENTLQNVDSGIAPWMECVTVNIIWKILHRRWTVVLQLELIVLQWTLYGRYCTGGGQWYFSLNGMCYSEHYMEDNAQWVDSVVVAEMKYVTFIIQ